MSTYQNVMNKFEFTLSMLQSNLDSIREQVPVTRPAWYVPATIARWLFGSSKQFVEDYEEVEKRYTPRDETEAITLLGKASTLGRILETTRREISIRFPADPLVMEATRQ